MIHLETKQTGGKLFHHSDHLVGGVFLGESSRNIHWIGLAQDRDRWRTLVSAIMNFRVP